MTYGIETSELVWDTPSTVFHEGDLVRKLRTAEGRDWTVEQLAEKAGLNKGTVSKLERGELDPRKSTLEKIAAALDVSAAYLLSGGVTSPDRPVRDDAPSMKEGAADVLAAIQETRHKLDNHLTLLLGAVEGIRRDMADLDARAQAAQSARKPA